MKKFQNPFKTLTKFEWTLWILSLVVVSLSFLIPQDKDLPSLIASLVGVTALIFLAKGMVIGQVLVILFAVLYGIVSWSQRYYGEMITYLGMSAPMAVSATISWLKNPYEGSAEVAVRKLRKKDFFFLSIASIAVTVLFFFLLKALNTANVWVSTISVTTSFFAASLTFLRSPYYALGYTANDIVLIILWIFSAATDISYLPMVFCFIMFLLNDLYGFWSWKRMESRQTKKIQV